MERVRPAGHLRRSRLEQRLDEALGRRLILVVADAGFGKSTLLAQWDPGCPVAMLTLTHQERNVGRLLKSIITAIRQVQNVSIEPDPSSHHEDSSPHAVASWLAVQLSARLPREIVLVLDDVHELGRRGAAARFLESLVLQAPSTLHVVLATRTEPPFRTQRLRGKGEVLELTASALAFRPDEVDALLVQNLGPSDQGLTEAVFGATRGWPAAVRLTIESLRAVAREDRPTAIERLSSTDSPLLSYLAEEVIGRQPEGVREFIRRVALLDQFTAESCRALGLLRTQATIDRLLQSGLAVRLGTGEVTLHELIRDFALARMPLTNDERRQVLNRAVVWLESSGDVVGALRYACEAGSSQLVRRLLLTRGQLLLLSGQAAAIENAAAEVTIPNPEPELDELIGEAHAVRGDWERALARYRHAAAGVDRLSARLAWLLGRLEWDRGHLRDAFDAFSRGDVDGTHPADEALLQASKAIAQWNRGESEAAAETASEALRRATKSGDGRALAAAHMATAMTAVGWDAARRRDEFRLALRAAEDSGDVLQAIRLRVNLCFVSPPMDGLLEIEPAIRLAELAGSDISLGIALTTRGEDLLALGRYEEAATDLRQALAIFEERGSTRAAWALMNLADVERERGNIALAQSLYRDAHRRAARAADAQGLIRSRAGLARLIAIVEPRRARNLAAEAVEQARPLQLYLATSLLAAGWVAAAQNRLDEARHLSTDAEVAAYDQSWPSALAEALELRAVSVAAGDRQVDLLQDAIAVWRDIGNEIGVTRGDVAIARLRGDRVAARRSMRTLRALGVSDRAADAAGLLACLPEPEAAPVEIRTLGGFAVVLSGRPVAIAAWRSRKAREVLKVLVARRGRAIPREELTELFWPDARSSDASNQLSVATSLIRRVLDPDKRYLPNHFIEADRQSVALARDKVAIDVDEFLAEAAAGLNPAQQQQSAIAMLEDAEAMYAGDFLEEDPYEDWVVGLREEARGVYIAAARRLAEYAAARGDHDVATRYLRRLLERDQFDESAHLKLVRTLEAAGQHGEARRAYRAYLGRMDELEVEPAQYPT